MPTELHVQVRSSMPLVWSSPSAWRQTIANLTSGRRLISDPGKWTVGAAARTATGCLYFVASRPECKLDEEKP